jgi:predicted transcriptional regulator
MVGRAGLGRGLGGLDMRDIVASIHPRHAQAILDGTKTVELRRKVWRMGAEIDRMFLYETAPTSALVGHVRVGVCQHDAAR